MPAPNFTVAELQVEAVRGVLEELLTGSPSSDVGRWAMHAIGEISRILDMTEPLQVMAELHDQEERRAT